MRAAVGGEKINRVVYTTCIAPLPPTKVEKRTLAEGMFCKHFEFKFRNSMERMYCEVGLQWKCLLTTRVNLGRTQLHSQT